jgi:Right handed beta helix region
MKIAKNLLFCLAIILLVFSCSNPSTIGSSADSQAAGIAASAPDFTSTTVTTASALSTAISNAKAGDVITISGTIASSSAFKLSKSGTSSSYITLQGGTLNFSGCSSYGLNISGSYWKISGIAIENDGDTPVYITGSYNIIQNCNIHNNSDMGLLIRHGGAHNQVNSCNSHDNFDSPKGENADGYGTKWEGGSGNVYNNCLSNHNSDDGWDLWMYTSTVTFNTCTSTNNGYGTGGDGNGFKLGGNNVSTPHTLKNCVANNNLGYGYTGNSNPAHMTMTNCTGSGNKKGLMDRIY